MNSTAHGAQVMRTSAENIVGIRTDGLEGNALYLLAFGDLHRLGLDLGGFTTLDDFFENFKRLALQIVFVYEAVETFDLGALAKFFD